MPDETTTTDAAPAPVEPVVDSAPADDTFDEAAALFPSIAKYKKLAVSLVGTTGPFVVYLLESAHSPADIVTAATAYVLLNFGVYEANNA